MRVLVDTSVWIDYINDRMDSEPVLKLDALLHSTAEVCLCPVIYQEVLQGIRDERLFHEVKELLSLYPMLEPDFPYIEDSAVTLYRSLRRQGITIRKSNDCLIAAYAIAYGVPVLFRDRDFDALCARTALERF